MSPADEYAFQEFCRRFGDAPPPQVFGNPGHCSECADANRRLMSFKREDFDAELLAEPGKSWLLSWMGADGFRFFLPGICRVAMENPLSNLGLFLDRLHPEWLLQLASEQKHAIHDLLCYCRDCGYASDDYVRKELRAKIEVTAR
jgi:hypothetical protein